VRQPDHGSWGEVVSVLVVSPRYAPHPGGIEKLLAQVLPELRGEGLDVVVATGTADGVAVAETVDGVPVYRLPFLQAVESGRAAEMLRVAARLREVERDHSVEVRHVHGFGDIGLWYVWRDHCRTPKPLGVTVHGTVDPVGPIGSTGTALLAAAQVVSAVSDAVAISVRATVPSCAGRIRVIKNGIRPHQGAVDPSQRPGHLLAVGRLDNQKGFDVAIDAMAILQPKYPDVELFIVGRGRGRTALRDRAVRAGVAARVQIVDHLAEPGVTALMRTASVVLVPSRTTEGFSLVALEAAQAGRPVVASRVGGLPETVEDGVTGILVTPGDPVALAEGLDRLLGDPSLADHMGLAGQRRAHSQYNLRDCVAGYRDMYRDLFAHLGQGQPVERDTSRA
jgi:glycogen(starch) synthase